nr:hypothetical protein [Kibdelosporangium sp. MJ126-NF4]CTQ90983.1 hypothetical protein [Kibdelosporangium sp. MJ126-NF4]
MQSLECPNRSLSNMSSLASGFASVHRGTRRLFQIENNANSSRR